MRYFSKIVVWYEYAAENGAPGEIRTPDPLVRSQVLYPAELRARCAEERLRYHKK